MPLTPIITITGHLQDIFGGASLAGKLRVTLRGFGSNMPRIVGTSILVDPDVEVTMPGDGSFSFTPWGVDVITPGPNTCYYEVSYEPAAGGVVKSVAYQFAGSGSFDLSSLTPFNGAVTPPAPANAVVTNPPGSTLQVIAGPLSLYYILLSQGAIGATENPEPAGASGTESLWADSTAHRWKMKTGSAGPSDVVVGAKTVDTLSGKTLTGVSSGNSVSLLNEQGPVAQQTGTGADQVVYTYTLPANTLGAGKGIRIRCWIQHTQGSAAITYRTKFGGTTFGSGSPTDTATVMEYFETTIFNNSGVTNAQHGNFIEAFNNGGSFGLGNPATGAIDTTAPVVISVTFNVVNTDKVTGAQFIVELVQ